MIKRSALVIALLLQGACGLPLLDDSCGPVQRFTSAEGEVSNGGSRLVYVRLQVAEERGKATSMGAIFMGERGSFGAPLRGHVLSARVIDGATGAALHNLQVHPAPPMGDEVIGATGLVIPNTEAVKRVMLDGDAVLVLTTDLAGMAEVRVPLPDAYDGDWGRASCS